MNEPIDTSMAMMLGEVRGQLRELVHQGNDQNMKNDAVARSLAKLESVPEDIAEIKNRLTALENERSRREGAAGALGAILKSPALGWFVGAATTVWLYITGRLTL